MAVHAAQGSTEGPISQEPPPDGVMCRVPFRELCDGYLDKFVTLRAVVEDEHFLSHSENLTQAKVWLVPCSKVK